MRIIIAPALALIVILFVIVLRPSYLPEHFGLASAKTTNIDRDGVRFTRITADNGTAVLVVEHADMTSADALQYIGEKKFQIESLYQSTPAPYPDVLTKSVVCPEEFMPVYGEVKRDYQDSIYYVMYANDRLSYGVCSQDLIKYRALFSLVNCKSGKVFQIELFDTNRDSNLAEKILSFDCRLV